MIPRHEVIKMAGELNKENPTKEALLLSMILHTLLDIRDQNGEMLKQQSDGHSNEPK